MTVVIPQARLIEVFESFQGEGPYLGVPMVFVRFQDCALSCQYCDTPDSFRELPEFRLEQPPMSEKFSTQPNPISASGLSELLQSFSSSRITLTGGEPLQHSDFLAHWLPTFKKIKRSEAQTDPWILLETNGVLPEALQSILPQIDVISMDIKLPSTTGMRAYWEEHEAFFNVAKDLQNPQGIYVKLVIGINTTPDEIIQALQLVKKHHPQAPIILQPVTPKNNTELSLNSEKLASLYRVAHDILPQVRVVPQMHPVLNIL